jgi:hypothetical protein
VLTLCLAIVAVSAAATAEATKKQEQKGASVPEHDDAPVHEEEDAGPVVQPSADWQVRFFSRPFASSSVSSGALTWQKKFFFSFFLLPLLSRLASCRHDGSGCVGRISARKRAHQILQLAFY